MTDAPGLCQTVHLQDVLTFSVGNPRLFMLFALGLIWLQATIVTPAFVPMAMLPAVGTIVQDADSLDLNEPRRLDLLLLPPWLLEGPEVERAAEPWLQQTTLLWSWNVQQQASCLKATSGAPRQPLFGQFLYSQQVARRMEEKRMRLELHQPIEAFSVQSGLEILETVLAPDQHFQRRFVKRLAPTLALRFKWFQESKKRNHPATAGVWMGAGTKYWSSTVQKPVLDVWANLQAFWSLPNAWLQQVRFQGSYRKLTSQTAWLRGNGFSMPHRGNRLEPIQCSSKALVEAIRGFEDAYDYTSEMAVTTLDWWSAVTPKIDVDVFQTGVYSQKSQRINNAQVAAAIGGALLWHIPIDKGRRELQVRYQAAFRYAQPKGSWLHGIVIGI